MMYLILFVVYCGLLWWITTESRRGRVETEGEFYMGERSSGVWSIACSSVSAIVEPVTIIFIFGLILMFGYAGAGIFTAYFVTSFLMVLLVPSFYNKAVSTNSLTLADFIKNNVGVKTEKLYAVITLLFVMGAIIGAYSANLGVFKFFLEMDKWTATILTFGITLGYVVWGGFRTVVRTDILQYVLMAVIFGAISFALPNNSQVEWGTMGEWFSGAFLMLAPVFFFQNLVKPAAWQPILGARDVQTAQRGMLLGAVLMMVLILPIIYAAFILKVIFVGTEPMEVMFKMVDAYFVDYKPYVFIAFVATMMSSIDTALFYVGTLINRTFEIKKHFPEVSSTKISQILIIAVSIVALLLAMNIKSFQDFIMSIMPIVGIVTLPFIGSMLFDLKKFDKEIALSCVAGVLVFFYQFTYPATDYIWNIIPVVTTFIVFFILGGSKK